MEPVRDAVAVDELTPPVVAIVGKSGSGKTTLLEKLIGELRNRGYKVAVVKHHSHGEFEIDKPGKDSWRHAQAGADAIMIVSPVKTACVRRVDREPTLAEIAALLPDVDIILTEGFKRAAVPKVEVSRSERSTQLICDPNELVAVVADYSVSIDAPVFGLEDVSALASLIETRFLADRPKPRVSLIVGGERIPIWKPFTAGILESTIRGMLSALQGVSKDARIVLTIDEVPSASLSHEKS